MLAQVGVIERCCHLIEQPRRPIRRQRILSFEDVLQVFAFDPGHHHLDRVANRLDVVDRDDVRVLQHRRHLRLANEAVEEARAQAEIGVHDLERHPPTQPRVVRPVHRAHAAPAGEHTLGVALIARRRRPGSDSPPTLAGRGVTSSSARPRVGTVPPVCCALSEGHDDPDGCGAGVAG